MEVLETIEKPAKRTYQKHKIDGKVSVLHYVNQNLKPQKYTTDVYPIYLRITIKRQTTNVKSFLSILNLSKSEFENQNDDSLINEIKKQEILGIKKLLKKINAFSKENFEIKEISSNHKIIYKLIEKAFNSMHEYYLERFIDDYITKLDIESEVNELFSFINLDKSAFIEKKRVQIASILSKLIPGFKLESVDSQGLLDTIKLIQPLSEYIYEPNND